jgi:biotin carboxylase
MNVLMISPGFPVEQPLFTRGLAKQGARVIGLGDQPRDGMPEMARNAMADYIQIRSFSDEQAIVDQVRQYARHVPIHLVESTWEPTMLLAARIREALGVRGMSVAETVPYRDKEVMKQILDRAGIRTPRHGSATTKAGVREAVARIGYPVCVKPIAGAGSADTYRVDNDRELEDVLARLDHIQEVSIEEFVEGDDYTFDTICVDGEIKFWNICVYRPRALDSRSNEWISPQTIVVRDVNHPALAKGREMGLAVLKALGFKTGFTHMEWYRKADGEAVFGEIGARPAGSHTVDIMNYANDIDLYEGWAEAVVHGRFSQPLERKYNAISIFKRAQGEGRIQRIVGLEGLLAEYGPAFACIDLLPVGAPRRNWLQTLRSDGLLVVRHPDFTTACEIADQVGTRLQLYAS